MNEDLSYKHLISEFGKRFKSEELPETLHLHMHINVTIEFDFRNYLKKNN